jgi:TRAP-type C4-dicarboxylate transport system substrate-binding protein
MRGFKTANVTYYHTTNANLFSNAFCVVMNKNKWQKLPADIQKAIEEASGMKAAKMFGQLFDKITGPDKKFMKEKGDTFTTISAEEKERWQNAIKGIRDKWVTDMEAKGMPSGKILNEMISLSQKYSK